MKRALLQILAGTWRFLLIVLILALIGFIYYRYEITNPSTNDAQVDAYVIPIASRLDGIVTQVFIRNNQLVKQGQKLFSLQDKQYRYQLNEYQAKVAEASSAIQAAQAAVAAAQAQLNIEQSATQLAQINLQRQQKLVAGGASSKQDYDNANNAYKQAAAKLKEQQNLYAEQQAKLTQAQATLRDNQALLNNAKLQLSYTVITAPIDGYISNFYLRAGAPVKAYDTLFGIIQPQPVWIIGYFLETELKNIRPGQTAKIRLLMYPDQVFDGKVESVGYGILSSQQQSAGTALPQVDPQLSWIRLAQRFPVRIIVINPSSQYPLRVGANARVKIYTGK